MDFLKFTDTGLLAASRQEIYAHLSLLAKQAYGNDISLDEGTAFDSFLQLLSDSLSSVNGSALSFSEIFSSKQASGTFLDFIAGGRGVLRKTKRNQRVVMTVILNNETEKPFLARRNTLFVQDGVRFWVNTEQLVVQERKFLPDGSFGTEENFQGTCEFGLLPLDGYDTDLLTVGTYSEGSPMPFDECTNESLQDAIKSVYNSVNATPAVLTTETDAQLRARYDRAVYAGSMSAVEVLSLALLRLPGIDFVRIVENLTSSTNEYGMAAHSVWCIVGGDIAGTAVNVVGVDSALADGDAFDGADLPIGSYVRVDAGVNIMGGSNRVLGSIWERTGKEVLTSRVFNVRLPEGAVDVETPLADGAAFNAVNITVGMFIRVRESEINIMGSVDRAVGTVWKRTGAEALTLVGLHNELPVGVLDVGVAQAILNYKSLGCGVSVGTTEGHFLFDGELWDTCSYVAEIPMESMVAEIPFTRVVNNTVSFNVVLVTTVISSHTRDLVGSNISLALQEFVSGLEPGEVVTKVDVMGVIQSVLSKYERGKFDYKSHTVSYALGSGIEIYQKAIGGTAAVTFADE